MRGAMMLVKTLKYVLVVIISLVMMPTHSVAEEECCHDKDVASEERSVYSFTVNDIDEDKVSLDKFKGKVLLIVNTASFCGFTAQYEALQGLYDRFKEKGLVVLGFPSGDFGDQEHKSNAEIKDFCETRFHIKFPIFAKSTVANKEGQSELFTWLTSKEVPSGDGSISRPIKWNFEKFLIDTKGQLVRRYRSSVAPKELESDILELLHETK